MSNSIPKLNLIKLKLNKDEIEILKANYDNELFKELKNKFGREFWFYRDGNFLYAWKINLDANKNILLEDYEFEEYLVDINDNLNIFRKIIETGIFSYLKKIYEEKYGKGYVFFKKYNGEIWVRIMQNKSNQKDKNTHLEKEFGDISLEPFVSLSVKSFFTSNFNEPFIGITINKRYKSKFNISPEELEKKGFDIKSFDIRENIIPASPKNIKAYFTALGNENLEKNYFSIFRNIKEEEVENLIKKTSNFIHKIQFHEGLQIESEPIYIIYKNFEKETFKKPKFYFYKNKTETKKDKTITVEKLSELQPFSFDKFKNKTIKISVVFPRKYEGDVETFVNLLEYKLRKVFYLNTDSNFYFIEEDNLKSYLESIEEITPNNSDLTLIIVSEVYKNYHPSSSPYFVLKAKLLNIGVVSQEANIEKIRKMFSSGNSFKDFYLNTIALNIYSKLGGNAWVIDKEEEGYTPEFIVGIGTSLDEKKETVYGMANIFGSAGYYIYGDNFSLVYKDDYTFELVKYLIKTLEKSIKRNLDINNIEEIEKIRVIFHLYKNPAETKELKAVNECIKEFKKKYPNVKIDYAFVNISQRHTYDFINKESLNKGFFLQLSKYDALLHFDKNKKPLLIKVDKRSTYIDLGKIGRQIYNFSFLGYRSFLPSKKPITIEYPHLMAFLLNKLRLVNEWDKDNINKFLLDKPWFI